MRPEDDNLIYLNSVSRSDENISRLVKLTNDSNKPGKVFTESLIDNALGELEHLKTALKQELINVRRWQTNVGWAAMVAAGCGAVLAAVASTLLKINLLLEAVVILTVAFNWLTYFGEHTL
jgi:Flp pilus assembly protein TadB